MRISDWSSDVCSSDLVLALAGCKAQAEHRQHGADRHRYLPVGSERPTHPVQVAPETGKLWMAAVGQLHLDQFGRLGAGLEIGGHVVMEYAHATGCFDLPVRCELRPQQIGRAHVCTPVTNAHLVCRLLLYK